MANMYWRIYLLKLKTINFRGLAIMKKHFLLLIIISLMLIIFPSCSKKEIDSNVNQSKLDYSFTYLDDSGNLHLYSYKKSSDSMLLKGENLENYDFNANNNCVAYVSNGNIVIQDLQNKTNKTIYSSKSSAKKISWSPDGRYLAANFGLTGYVQIYDSKNDSWIKIENGTSSFIWSPDSSKLAVGLVQNYSGNNSVTTSLILLNKENTIKTLIKGSEDFCTEPFYWESENNLVIRKSASGAKEYSKYLVTNINDGSISEANPNLPDKFCNEIPEFSYDRKYVLYESYDYNEKSTKIYIYNTEDKTYKYICQGKVPKWIK
jgi:WD40 repeat protein